MTWAGSGPSGTIWTLNTGGGLGRVDWEEVRGDVSGVIDNLILIAIQGTSVNADSPLAGNVLTFDGSSWIPSNPVAGSGHNLLSITHLDTTAASPIAGDIITGSGSPASWIRFPIGSSSGLVLSVSDSLELEWTEPNIILPSIYSSGSVINLSNSDKRIIVNKSVGSPTVINLSSNPVLGQEIIIKDGKGDAITNEITILPQSGSFIDGFSQVVMGQNYSSYTLYWNGTEWNIL